MTNAPWSKVGIARSSATSGVAVELVGITKRFPGVLANDNVSFDVKHGEVHCLLGENGAGKSTLVSILSGMQNPDAGQIRIDGQLVSIDSPRRALDLGIGTVYQHSSLIPALTVLENLMLGENRGLMLQLGAARRRLRDLAEMLGIEVDPSAQFRTLALGQQQQVGIIKALWRGSRVLILDEPTSMLTPEGVADLQKVLVRLKDHGLAVVFITHKLHEACAIGDRISILKGGRAIATLESETLRSRTNEELQALIVDMMFGEEARFVSEVVELRADVEGGSGARALNSEVVLELAGVSTGDGDVGAGIRDVSFAAHKGEILGIAGVDGNGQRELAEVIAGQRPLTAGEIRLDGAPINGLSVSARQRLGVRYITDDRLGEGIVSSLSVALNLVLKRIGQKPFWRRGVIQREVVDGVARGLVDEFRVLTTSIHARVGTLSGGNIQKVLLARELSFDPRVVVYNKPTQGLDVKTTRAVRQRIQQQAEDGVTAIVISTDLEEILTLSDSIAVLFHGRLQGIVANSPDVAERVGEMMIGGRAA